ncbi:deoxyguanosinetriphosphate triphosphohydrolase-like protein [compost metagenome]
MFLQNEQVLLEGNFNKSLTDALEDPLKSTLKEIERISVQRIYNYHSVVEIEIAGYKVMGGLLEEFVPAFLQNKTHYHKKLVELIPKQFITKSTNTYDKVQCVLDFVSGMTDLYAVELYRKIKGISFPRID